MVGLALALLALALVVWRVRFGAFEAAGAVAIDYRSFVDEGHRFLDQGTPYLPYQLAGPYTAQPVEFRQPADVPFLYPPPFVFVCVALTVIPAFLWWVVPAALLAAALISWRPAPWCWPLLAATLVWPATSAIVIVGGTTMWVAALVAGGLRWGWPAALIVLKPSFFPLALIGIRRRSWWIAAAAVGVASLAVLPLWPEYFTAIRNATDLSPIYSLGDLPLVVAPILAWLARRPTSAVQDAGREPEAATGPASAVSP